MKLAFDGTPNIWNTSPPVWGAWVEIVSSTSGTIRSGCRPPCGGRGLKSSRPVACFIYVVVAPRVGGVG